MPKDPVSLNVEGPRQLVQSRLNKIPGGVSGASEGVDGELEDVLSLNLSDEALLELSKNWTARYGAYEGKLKPRQEKNKQYYLGKQYEGTSVMSDYPIASNLLFEAEETFLPAALSKNPEPVVFTDNTPEGNKLAGDVETMLQYHADVLVLRRKLTMMTRHWSIYFIGVLKHGWSSEIEDIETEVRKPQNFLLDPTGYVDAYGDFHGWIGEKITVPAEDLIDMFPKERAYITVMVDGKLGTDVTYTEWWTDKYCFYTFKDRVLDKHKNQHFNYDQTVEGIDEDGEKTSTVTPGRNHFARPQKPYTFLTVFSLGEQPHDVTGLLEQNIPNQNIITKRTVQIDKNLDSDNNSTVFSEDNFNEETARQAATAMQKGNPVLVPAGKPLSEAIMRFPAQGFDAAAYNQLETMKNDLRAIFGTEGITANQQDEDQTARGMILNQQYSNSRIGGGIGDALEQVADNVFNWWLQLYYVYYDEPHYAAIIGQMKSVEYVVFSNVNLTRKMVVSVAPNSLKPKDEVSEMNQALTLWQEGALDPQTLMDMLKFPNPKETAAQVWLWRTNPQLYGQMNFPDIANLVASLQPQTMQQPGQPPVPGNGVPAPEVPMQPQPTTGGVPATASLSAVPLPTIAQ